MNIVCGYCFSEMDYYYDDTIGEYRIKNICECMKDYYIDDSYNNGYDDGYNDRFNEDKEEFNSMLHEMRKREYNEGFSDGIKEIKISLFGDKNDKD